MASTKTVFRIMGEDLDPCEITQRLRMQPDQAHCGGDPHIGKLGQRYAGYTAGIWALQSSLDEQHTLAEHLEELIAKLGEHGDALQAWRNRGYTMDIFVGIFGCDDNMGWVLKHTLLQHLVQLGVDLDLDLYPA
ncbi:MAG: DUF4279 domain-containing protein [Candidatus Tectomicrobia bacterium]|uniref:DUF4279 domain-containing protein n=1 Tax=Tectimicrobiota bacterium TaxID=2528274 RepID=A0A937VYX6_UNCTE|nr:DUF4279 domain-containing protein [Candidatus Tectomicrobia bacterium]